VEKFSYSINGYLLISIVLQKITNKKASNYLKELLFDPMELSSTENIDKVSMMH
jgi:CubicO group peptidase (beta-lactamase class C family)